MARRSLLSKKRAVVDDSSSSDDDDAPTKRPRTMELTVDASGIRGDAVQLPAPAILRIVKRAVDAGARSSDAIIDALGGEVNASNVSEILSRFTIECCLAICVSRDEVEDKASIRVLVKNEWYTGHLKNVGGMRFASVSKGALLELTSQSWWYPYSPYTVTTPVANVVEKRIATVRLEGKTTVEGTTQAARLRTISQSDACSYLVKRLGGPKAIGERMACLAVLAISEFQTEDEIQSRRTIHKNGRGWNEAAAPAAHKIVDALKSKRLLTREEMDTAFNIVSAHVMQLLLSNHLAEVLAFGAPDERIVEGEEGDDEGDDGDFVVPDECDGPFGGYPDTNDGWLGDFGASEQVLRFKDARFLNYYAYVFLASLKVTHGADTAAIIAEMKKMWGDVRPLDVQVALCQLGSFVSEPNQKVSVLWTEEFQEGVATVYEPGYVFVSYSDGERLAMNGQQLMWHYVTV